MAAAEANGQATSEDPLHALAATKIGRLTRGSETLTFEHRYVTYGWDATKDA